MNDNFPSLSINTRYLTPSNYTIKEDKGSTHFEGRRYTYFNRVKTVLQRQWQKILKLLHVIKKDTQLTNRDVLRAINNYTDEIQLNITKVDPLILKDHVAKTKEKMILVVKCLSKKTELAENYRLLKKCDDLNTRLEGREQAQETDRKLQEGEKEIQEIDKQMQRIREQLENQRQENNQDSPQEPSTNRTPPNESVFDSSGNLKQEFAPKLIENTPAPSDGSSTNTAALSSTGKMASNGLQAIPTPVLTKAAVMTANAIVPGSGSVVSTGIKLAPAVMERNPEKAIEVATKIAIKESAGSSVGPDAAGVLLKACDPQIDKAAKATAKAAVQTANTAASSAPLSSFGPGGLFDD